MYLRIEQEDKIHPIKTGSNVSSVVCLFLLDEKNNPKKAYK